MAPTDRIEVTVSLSHADRVGLLHAETLRLDVTDHPAVKAALSGAREEGRREGVASERERIVGGIVSTTGRPIADGGQYRADIASSLLCWAEECAEKGRQEERADVVAFASRRVDRHLALCTADRADMAVIARSSALEASACAQLITDGAHVGAAKETT